MNPNTPIRAAIIGCGRPKVPGKFGGGQAQNHVRAYKKPGIELVALADIAQQNLDAFQAEHGARNTYLDYREMLETERPDIVSVCTWPALHAPMVQACADAGAQAVYCEKPMAPTWGAARAMVAHCEQKGTVLGFNHQRRFGEPFVRAKQMLDGGEIGDLQRLEATCDNLFDWGTHWFDMMFFYNDETPVDWVLGQIEWRGARKIFGAPIENQGLSYFGFRNGVTGLLTTGRPYAQGTMTRLIGTEGTIEVAAGDANLRILGKGDGWQNIETSEGAQGGNFVERALTEFIEAWQSGREPQMSARHALQATELIYATYESSRRRGRVKLPLEIEDSPLQWLLDENGVEL